MNLVGAVRAGHALSDLDRQLRASLGLPASEALSLQSMLSDARHTTEVALHADSQAAVADPALISQSLSLQMTLHKYFVERRAAIMRALPASLRRLNGVDDRTTTRALCVELVSTAGLGRAVFSDVREGTLRPSYGATATGDGIESMEFTDDLRVEVTEDSVEHSCITTTGGPRRAEDAGADTAMAKLLATNTYAIAPIIVTSSVTAMIHVAPPSPLAIDDDDLECLAAYQGAVSATFSRDTWFDIAVAHHAAVRRAATTIVEDASRVTADDFDIGSEVPSEAHPQRHAVTTVNYAIEDCLTSRETEVMRLIAQGLSNAEIADRLFIGVETVKSHVKKVLRKIGAVNRSEAISLYLDNGRTTRGV